MNRATTKKVKQHIAVLILSDIETSEPEERPRILAKLIKGALITAAAFEENDIKINNPLTKWLADMTVIGDIEQIEMLKAAL